MKHYVCAIISFLLITSCKSQEKEQKPTFGIETCFEKNLSDSTLLTGWYAVVDTDSGFIRPLEKSQETYALNPRPVLTAEDIIKLEVSKNNYGSNMLTMRFGERGTELWSEATQVATGKELAFVLNDKLLYVAFVNSQITAGVSALIRDDYSPNELNEIKNAIELNKENMKNLSENKALNEEWHNHENMDLPVDTSAVDWHNKPHHGTDCYFREDETFEIRLWWYGVSIGLREALATGNYHFNPLTREILLIFNGESSIGYHDNEPFPTPYYFMKGLSQGTLHFIFENNEIPILSKSCLRIIEPIKANKISVELYAYKENGEKMSFGKTIFIQENLTSLRDKK
jgi:hypothetical protein